MQFIINLFGTVHATKDVGKQASGLYALDEKLRVLSNHVDFLLQEHFSHQSCQVKTYEVYTSENDGQGEDREGGGPSVASDGEEEDSGRNSGQPDTDLPSGDSQENRPSEGETGAGPGEASSAESRTDAQNSH